MKVIVISLHALSPSFLCYDSVLPLQIMSVVQPNKPALPAFFEKYGTTVIPIRHYCLSYFILYSLSSLLYLTHPSIQRRLWINGGAGRLARSNFYSVPLLCSSFSAGLPVSI